MRVRWVPALLVDAHAQTPASRTLVFVAPDLESPLAGQHVDVRLTAEDGYTAQRAYSLGSPAGADRIELTVDRMPDGEVSPYLVDMLQVGNLIEVRGPIGQFFVWRPEQTEPVQLIAGGSGIVPLMSMIRTREAVGGTAPMRLLYSVRTPEGRLYADELDALATAGRLEVQYVYTREAPADWEREAGRLTPELLAELTLAPDQDPAVYVCGPTPFVEAVADGLVQAGHRVASIRTERFGPSG
ncbi:ferredoxin reductase [Naasia aerilata]|uniref:Oxidoreductase n=1 Tax=Naasia aerilata TaxID=1162966 RepID=A0ABN6XS28_9MICO|nr:ferredoxin reductase [Naasia aerilata]BDZ46238.1 oxidoreductase [Naasia aerilata]